MATTTYVPIESKTLGSAATNITFTSIPQTYTDLIVVFNGSSDGTSQYFMQLGNGTLDTNSNYSTTVLDGNGSSAASARYTNDTVGIRADYYATGSGNMKTTIFQIQNYSNTTTYKTVLVRSSLPATEVVAAVGLWRSTSAINTLKVYSNSGNFNAGAIVTLYGIANADSGAKATGGVITYDDTYFYHTFGSSGTFTPQQSLTADVLVVAGGGGGGCDKAGGGGAGGLAFQTGRSLSATGYSITVGAGGAGVSSNGVKGVSGGNSVFDTITALGGGGGGSENNIDGANGGSAGGGCRAGIGGTATQGSSGGATGFGNNGGNGNNGTNSIYAGGGGGGAGTAGANAPTSGTVMAVGGNGVNTYSSWLSIVGQGVNGYIAAGGGSGGYGPTTLTGGSGGLGGGGNGGGYNPDTAGTNAIVNTGSGGGGGGNGLAGGNGASGLVVIRYLKA